MEEESRPAQAEVPKRAFGRSGELVSMVGLGGFHVGLSLLKSTSSTTAPRSTSSGSADHEPKETPR